jgi:hypothetical protein
MKTNVMLVLLSLLAGCGSTPDQLMDLGADDLTADPELDAVAACDAPAAAQVAARSEEDATRAMVGAWLDCTTRTRGLELRADGTLYLLSGTDPRHLKRDYLHADETWKVERYESGALRLESPNATFDRVVFMREPLRLVLDQPRRTSEVNGVRVIPPGTYARLPR